MATIFFCSHSKENYSTEDWRCILSQWYSSDKSFIATKSIYDLNEIITEEDWQEHVENKLFNTREQWMMYFKALVFAKGEFREENIKMAEYILSLNNQKTIREQGRKIKGYDEKIWNEWRYKIVLNGNYLQFSQDENMKKILIETGDREIVEAAWYDKIWGIGFRETDAVKNKENWGLNLLGKALMETRSLLKQNNNNQ